jgi:rubrerythrin
MRTHRSLAVLFAHIAAAAVACGGSTSNGADPSSLDGGAGGDGGAAGACGFKTLDELSPAAQLDFIALRGERVRQGNVVGDGGVVDPDAGVTLLSHDVTDIETFGTPCSTARDPGACKKALDDLRVLTPPAAGSGKDCVDRQFTPEGCQALYVVYTSGDTVRASRTPDELRGALGAIDTADEAWLMARLGGYAVKCDSSQPGIVPSATKDSDGYVLEGIQDTGQCGPVVRMKVRVTRGGQVSVIETVELASPPCAIGRRPDGLTSDATRVDREASSVGDFFARAALLEDASVYAFMKMAEELLHHGAPASLADKARRSAADERRHTRVTRRLARKYGARPEAAVVEPRPVRDLTEIARENAVEGCVRETYGALLAAYQARAAGDPEVRAALAQIAEDEARHAELSWEVHAWALARMSRDERAEIDAAMRSAISELTRELEAEPDASLARDAGIPTARDASALMRELARAVWS